MARISDHPVLGRGFRPFFILGSFYSVVNLLIWGGFYSGYASPPDFFLDPVSWHAHEMIYGFTMAIVAGFLLTAVANWTAGAPVRQYHLFSLCALWLMGRLALNMDIGLPFWVLMALESAFIPALAISLAVPLLRSWNKRNFIFLTLLSALWACDVWFMISLDKTPLYIAVMMIVIMISLIGGRIIPAFTVAALRRKGIEAHQTPQMGMDMAAIASLLCVAILMSFAPESPAMFFCAAVSAIIHLLRMRRYHTFKTFDDPMLWILQAGYLWLVLGLLLLSLSGIKVISSASALHALTAGSIGSMTLGMMCRVTMGHTGRGLKAPLTIAISFGLMNISALLRVLGPILLPSYTGAFVIASAILWALCFFLFTLIYTPMLWSPRPDGLAA